MNEPVLLEPIELTEAELDAVFGRWAAKPKRGWRFGQSRPRRQELPIEGPLSGPDHNFP
jgi:hypothetical protein